MAFRTFLKSLGANAPSVETVIANRAVRPGDRLQTHVTVKGGGADVRIDRLVLELVTRAEDREGDETGWNRPVAFAERHFGPFELRAGETLAHGIDFDVPWETPLTYVLGRPLRGGRVAVRTTLEIDNAVDRGDFDEIAVHALPAQDVFVEAYRRLGFRLDEAEVKMGVVQGGDNQTMPFWQEIEFYFPDHYRRPQGEQLETGFFARADSLDVFLGSTGAHRFEYAGLTVEACEKWLDAYCREEWQM
ncbi:sporulation protein [Actinomadura kijaniata]|uniref:sporulation protein n=1 Tax=Actinomadura kijaniata TaxID=46161 RepID=UPI000829D650|nr:sporulation protein [Actinomadura kijaniata]